ncbi:MAG: cellobiose phosphorylase [Lachnospiraceae bacterium]|nr:cellobiose phosphorylase [Lachnospiraceae bacterium]
MSNQVFLEKAKKLKPVLKERAVTLTENKRVSEKGDVALFDFGEHLTGKISFSFGYEGHHPDAPVWLRVRFAERLQELAESVEDYHGWISAGWVQTEEIHVDVIPCEFTLPRRYAFRYVQVEAIDISSRFTLTIERVTCKATTSADEEKLSPVEIKDPVLARIETISCATLKECMQDVFEDGPKRDRRLWLGDLRLQALTNYVTYQNYDLVRRCLYLFAGTAPEEGMLASNVFTAPEIEADDQSMFDYALLFAKSLEDYYEATDDLRTVKELWPTVKAQFIAAERFFTMDGQIQPSEVPHWVFVDWNLSLQKDFSALGIWLYCEKAAEHLANVLGDEAFLKDMQPKKEMRKVAGLAMFHGSLRLFVSGSEKQVSMSSQVWAVLGGLTEDAGLFARAEKAGALKMVSPYMVHYYVEALVQLGKTEEALDVIRTYWGGMAERGADTFWELYDPEDPDGSPYGGTIVNSYCHAWSCTPAYFLRTLKLL